LVAFGENCLSTLLPLGDGPFDFLDAFDDATAKCR
jgi:hypothetical protein